MDDTEHQRTRKLGFLDNSHRFLREAAEKARLASKDPDQWMFAVAALVQSVELALKGVKANKGCARLTGASAASGWISRY